MPSHTSMDHYSANCAEDQNNFENLSLGSGPACAEKCTDDLDRWGEELLQDVRCGRFVIGSGITEDEVIAALDATDFIGDETNACVAISQGDDALNRSKNVSVPSATGSNNVLVQRSKNVPEQRSKDVPSRRRRSVEKDGETIAKIRAFKLPVAPLTSSSLVTLSSPTHNPVTLSPANDNLVPVWALTGDRVKVLFANVALQIAEGRRHVAFTFNLTPDATDRAKAHSAGFLDCLKRDFDRELKRSSLDLLYWFAVDVGSDDRLHLHGEFCAADGDVEAVRTAMKKAWGAWRTLGKHKQVRFEPKPPDDGWATYVMRNQAVVSKLIGSRTFTICHQLRRDAEWAYTELRQIMRAEEGGRRGVGT